MIDAPRSMSSEARAQRLLARAAAGFPEEPKRKPVDPADFEYDLYLDTLFEQAEEHTRGYMTVRGCRDDPRVLFYCRRPGDRPWRKASEELRRAWATRDLPRPFTLAEWRAGRPSQRQEVYFAEQIRM